jgi:hypothetical protein
MKKDKFLKSKKQIIMQLPLKIKPITTKVYGLPSHLNLKDEGINFSIEATVEVKILLEIEISEYGIECIVPYVQSINPHIIWKIPATELKADEQEALKEFYSWLPESFECKMDVIIDSSWIVSNEVKFINGEFKIGECQIHIATKEIFLT